MGRNNQQRRRAKAKAKGRARAHRGGGQGQAHESAFSAPAGAEPGGGAFATSAGEALRDSAQRAAHEHRAEAVRFHLQAWREATRLRRFEDAAELEGLVLADLADPVTSRQFTGVTSRALLALVDDAWGSGWEPADLLRVAERVLDAPDLRILADAIAQSLSRFAAATIAPRWHTQARDAAATVWWPQSSDPLTTRFGQYGLTKRGVTLLSDALAFSEFLVMLHPLEVIEAPPGKWRPPAIGDPQKTPASERMLERVRRLLAKAESTPYEPEAETFTAAAQSLMARHSIDRAMLDSAMPSGRAADPVARRIGVDAPYEAPKATLLSAVAEANRCRIVWSKELGFVTVVGFLTDIEVTETLFTSLLVQATRAMTRHGARTTRDGTSRTRAFRQSFLYAYATRIGERLEQATQEQIAEAAAGAVAAGPSEGSGSGGSTGPGNVLAVLDTRRDAVDTATDAMFPNLVTRGTRSTMDGEGWSAGTRAADLARLGGGPALDAG